MTSIRATRLQHACVVDAVRTPRGKGSPKTGALRQVHPQELLAQTLNALCQRADVPPSEIDDVRIGCVNQVDEQGACIARQAVLAAQWPVSVPAVTTHRVCGAGLDTINTGAALIAAGYAQVVIAGGVESMSRVVIDSHGGGVDGQNPRLRRRCFQVPPGPAADLLATREGVSRAALDAYAHDSQRKAATAHKSGHFAKELVPVRDPRSDAPLLDRDECVRPSSTLAALARLRPAFQQLGAMRAGSGLPWYRRQPVLDPAGRSWDRVAIDAFPEVEAIEHRHTAGNSAPPADGAAAIMLASEDYCAAHGLPIRARVRSVAVCGSDPVLMFTGAAPAAVQCLARVSMTPDDIDLWEINEAFSVVPLQVMRELSLPAERVNVCGGAIALGHPFGATGAMMLTTAIGALERVDASTALVTMTTGYGMGVATLIERAS